MLTESGRTASRGLPNQTQRWTELAFLCCLWCAAGWTLSRQAETYTRTSPVFLQGVTSERDKVSYSVRGKITTVVVSERFSCMATNWSSCNKIGAPEDTLKPGVIPWLRHGPVVRQDPGVSCSGCGPLCSAFAGLLWAGSWAPAPLPGRVLRPEAREPGTRRTPGTRAHPSAYVPQEGVDRGS